MAIGPTSGRDRQDALLASIAAAAASAEEAKKPQRFAGRLARLVAAMSNGASAVFAAYGDSTTDGTGTTGWTGNPTTAGGAAIGAAAHTPANAWPAIAQTALRQMFENNSISVWNAGYGGKALVDGWALANIDAAIFNNPGYGTPQAVIISFGINDIRRASYSPGAFRSQLIALVDRIDQTGAFPIFLTPDATLTDDNANGSEISGVIEVYRAVGAELGIDVLDGHARQLEMWAARDGAVRWASVQSDTIHGDDNFHSLKGALIAAMLFPNTLWMNDDEVIDVAPWSKFCNAAALTFGIGGIATKFGGSMNIASGAYSTGQALLKMWAWNTAADRDLFWRGVDADGFYAPRALASAPVIAIYDYLARSSSNRFSPHAGWTAPAPGYRMAESPGYLGALPVGLSRVVFNAPTDNADSPVYLGHFAARRARSISQVGVLTHTGTEKLGRDQWANVGCPTLIGFGRGAPLDALYRATLADKTGFFLWSSRSFGAGATVESNIRRGLMLYRNNDTTLGLYDALLYGDGTAAEIGGALGTGTVTIDFWTNARIRARGVVSGTDQIVNIFGDWSGNTPLISVSTPVGSAPLAWGGTPCALFSNRGSAGTSIAVAELVAAFNF